MKRGIRRGNARAERKMVDELGAEEGFRSELLDFLGILRVVAEGARARLGEAGCREKTQREEDTEQAAEHI
jgi:hypothetical protein